MPNLIPFTLISRVVVVLRGQEKVVQLLHRDLIGLIGETDKGQLQVLLRKLHTSIHSRRDELRILDRAILVSVNAIENFIDLFASGVEALSHQVRLNKLIACQLSFALRIELHEELTDLACIV